MLTTGMERRVGFRIHHGLQTLHSTFRLSERVQQEKKRKQDKTARSERQHQSKAPRHIYTLYIIPSL